MTTWYICTSCGGVYQVYQKGGTYYHACPEGTRNPRNENWPIKGTHRDKGGADKVDV